METDGMFRFCLSLLSPFDEAVKNKLSLWSEMGNEINYFSSTEKIWMM
jgi:hypothetical protein